jgi:FlgD Ig-like domain
MQRNRYALAPTLSSCSRFTVIVFAFAAMTIGHPRPANAVTTTMLMSGVKSAISYDITRDGVPVTSGASTALGSLAFAMDITSGTLVAIAPQGDLAPPAPPLFASLDTGQPGCAVGQWLPSGDPTVIGYVVAYGRASVAEGDAPNYDQMIEVGAVSSLDVCALPLGTHYFALRAKNVGGMLSGYSSELSVEIVVVGVLISQFSATPSSDGVHLAWRVDADETVLGFRVFRSSATDAQNELTLEPLPPDATSYVDVTAEPGVAYTYILAAIRENGDLVFSMPIIVATKSLSFELEPNMPNPFNPSTRIGFTLSEAERAIVRIYDVRGSHVATLLDSRLGAGRHHVDWDGLDDAGTRVASGTYFYTLAAGRRTESRKMVLVK